jgi:hypothetical protein
MKLLMRKYCFFSWSKFREKIPESLYEEVLGRELWEWISAIYRGETFGIEYAFKMSELSSNEEEKKAWLETYAEEVDHQQRIENGFVSNNLYPLAPTLIMRKAQSIIERDRKAKRFYDYKDVIEKGRIFFEETGVFSPSLRFTLSLLLIFFLMN